MGPPAPVPMDEPSRPVSSSSTGPGSSAPAPAGYGRSCTNCSRAKCKCILRTHDGPCERCHRLGKDCRPIEASRKRITKKQSSSQTAHLEQKLDDIFSILRATNHPSLAGVLPPEHAGPFSPSQLAGLPSRLDSLATAATASSSENTSPYASNLSHHHHHSSLNPQAHRGSIAPDSAINPALGGTRPEPTPAEAEQYLDKFRLWLNNFPFMHITSDVSASDLRRQRPFLWLCIMNITSMSIPQMQLIKERVRMELAQKVFLDHEPSMDILLGILVCLTWSTMNSFPGSKPFLILFTQTATSIVYEMGLSRSPLEEQYFATSFKGSTAKAPPPRSRTAEERRVLLALWYLTSVTSSFVGKIDTLRWSTHMEESLDALEREKDNPGDEVLAAIVRLQLLSDEAHKLLLRDVASAGAAYMGGPPSSDTPSYVFRKNMMSRLQIVKERISPTAATNYVVQSHYHIAEVLIQFLGVFVPNVPDMQRIDSMYSCLRAVRSWYEVWFSIPLLDIPGLPYSIYTQLSQTQVALHRLTISEDPGWDKELLRNTADLLVILDRSAGRFEEVGRVYPQEPGEDCQTIWSKAVKILRNIKATWEPSLSHILSAGVVGGLPTPNSQGTSANVPGAGPNAAGSHPTNVRTAQPGPGGNVPGQGMVVDSGNPNPNPNAVLDPAAVDFNDLAWMTDVFGPWEF